MAAVGLQHAQGNVVEAALPIRNHSDETVRTVARDVLVHVILANRVR